MEEEQGLFESKAYAAKNELQLDFALRLSKALELAETLDYALATATVVEDDTGGELKRLYNFYRYKALESDKHPEIHRMWRRKMEEVRTAQKNYTKQIRREVDPAAFWPFFTAFKSIWREGREQIGIAQWAKNPLKTGKDTKDAINSLFERTSEGKVSPRETLVLFEAYLDSLTKAGILNFKYYSYKPSEVFRKSTG